MSRYLYPGSKARGAIVFAGQPSDGEPLIIGDRTYTFRTSASVAFDVEIGGTAALTAAALITAINLAGQQPSAGVTAVIDSKTDTVVRLFGSAIGEKPNVALDASGVTNVTASGATMTGGREKEIIVREAINYTVLAADVTADQLMIRSGLTTPNIYSVHWESSTGEQKQDITALVSVSGDDIVASFDGAVDPVAGDILRMILEDS